MTPLTFEGFGALISEIMGGGGGGEGGRGEGEGGGRGIILTYPDSYKTDWPEGWLVSPPLPAPDLWEQSLN